LSESRFEYSRRNKDKSSTVPNTESKKTKGGEHRLKSVLPMP